MNPMRQADYNPFEIPNYGTAEASRFLYIPPSTLQSWVAGKEPIVKLAAAGRCPMLSFKNLVECYVVQGMRTMYGIRLQKIRAASSWMHRNLASPNPLADYEITTNGINLFLDIDGVLVGISQEGQVAMRPVFEAHLKRVERDSSGIANRLFPYRSRMDMLKPESAPKIVLIDPMISFGRPILRDSGIRSSVLAGRYRAGDSIEELAKSYGRQESEIKEAVEWEIGKAA